MLELSRDPDCDLRQLAGVIQNDPAMAGKILRTVNSSYYGLTVPCPTIHRALTYLGLNLVRALVLGFSLVEATSQVDGQFDYIEFWRRSLYSATAARRVAQAHMRCDPDEAFTGALLQDIGMLALQTAVPKKYEQVLTDAGVDHRQLPEVERAQLGLDHAEVGEALGSKWKLPQAIVRCIREHHLAEPRDSDVLVRTVCCAAHAVLAMCHDDGTTAITRFRRDAARWFELSPGTIDELVRTLPEDTEQLGRLFNVQLGSTLEANRVLAEAEEMRSRIAIDQQSTIDQLRNSVNELHREASTDALTEIGNRKRFDRELMRWYEQASTFRGVLGLLLVDIDHFKDVNDTHGHQAGDEILSALAQRISTQLRDGDLLCRYGGEEFAVILPGTDEQAVAVIAERLRRVVAIDPFTVNSDKGMHELTITISVGGAAFGPHSAAVLSSAALVVRAADRALYAAKDAGRDTVRLFRVRPPQETTGAEESPGETTADAGTASEPSHAGATADTAPEASTIASDADAARASRSTADAGQAPATTDADAEANTGGASDHRTSEAA